VVASPVHPARSADELIAGNLIRVRNHGPERHVRRRETSTRLALQSAVALTGFVRLDRRDFERRVLVLCAPDDGHRPNRADRDRQFSHRLSRALLYFFEAKPPVDTHLEETPLRLREHERAMRELRDVEVSVNGVRDELYFEDVCGRVVANRSERTRLDQ